MSLEKIALFGANGQFGNAILHALMQCKQRSFHVLAFISPRNDLKYYGDRRNIVVHQIDLAATEIDENYVAALLDGVQVVLSCLGGSLLHRQRLIQDAAAKASVRRFYPSELGMHQVVRLPGEENGLLHPVWNLKMKCLEDAIKHPAVKSGKMTYTVIGCAEVFDVPREPLLCPWMNTAAEEYTLCYVGDPDAQMDYSSLHDVAAFYVASICSPELSENRELGFRSDHISFTDVAKILRRVSGKNVTLREIPIQTVKEIIADPSSAPDDLKEGSTFPVDFWLALRSVQGQGRFWRPPGQLSNALFKQVQTQSFADYLSALHGRASK